MRKHYLVTVLMAATATTAISQSTPKNQSGPQKDNFSLSVDLSKLSYAVDKLYFTFYNTTTKFRYTDSAVISETQRTATFKTSLDEPILAQLHVSPKEKDADRTHARRDNYTLYIEPGQLKAIAVDSLGNTQVTGSKAHKDFLTLKAKEEPYEPILQALYNDYSTARKAKDEAAQQAAEKKIDSVDAIIKEKVYKNYVQANPRSPVALYALSQYAGFSIDPSTAQPVYDLLSPEVKALPAGVAFQRRIDIAKVLEVGKPAPVFTQNDTAGNPVSLAAFKGKYVLVDFWASWCGPCRAENPNVVKAFNTYKEKGFTVVGVSLDRPGQKEKWLKAIHDDQLTWTQVSDLKFWDNDVAKLYDVKAIPQNFLLDKEGKIVAKNIRGEALQTKLAELVK